MRNLRRLACKVDLSQSERKSSKVNASARKSWPNGVASRPKFSTCGYLRLRLARALSPGQTDRQVVASGRKLNLRGNLRWVTKRTRKFPRKYTQVANKNVKPWSNGPASSRKWTQVELAEKLTLGGQTDTQVSSQAANKKISKQTILYFIG